MESSPPIRFRAAEEGSFEIPLWGVPLILVLVWVCLFSGLGAIGLVGPDEPRYAAIARAMAETHDWITPRLWGTPWFEKPVLYYWTAGITMRIFGISEFAARLPSALAALLAVVAAAWTALRSYGLGAAWYALLMLPASVAMVGFSRAAGPDMLFAGLLTAAMAVAVQMLQTDKPGAISQIAFGFFLGAAVLAKGPAAIILAGGATLVWGTLSRYWTAPFRFLRPLVIVGFCATALPWYVLCALRNPDFLRVFLWQHNFERYTTPIFEHRQPVWFYGYVLLLAVIPWVLYLLAALYGVIVRWKGKAAIDSIDIFFASWTLFPILFFSASQSKLPGYILPAIPPLFILLARWVAESVRNKSKALPGALGSTGILLLLLAVPFGAGAARNDLESIRVSYGWLLVVVLPIGFVTVAAAVKRRAAEGLLCITLLALAVVEIANLVVLPRIDPAISTRHLAQALIKEGASPDNVAIYGLRREWRYGLNFYFNRDLPDWVPGKTEPVWILGGPPPDYHQFFALYGPGENAAFDEVPFLVAHHR